MTLRYASPEQVRREPISTASDIYSLGVILHQLLTGMSPYKGTGDSWSEMVQAVCEGEPRRPSAQVPSGVRRQQLAGDEMPSTDPANLAATGFLRLGIYEYNQRNARTHWNDIMNEITDVTGDVFLGMGMACD